MLWTVLVSLPFDTGLHGTEEDALQEAEAQAVLEEGLGEAVHPRALAHSAPPSPSTPLMGKRRRRRGAGEM